MHRSSANGAATDAQSLMHRSSANGATTDGQSSQRRSKVVLELHHWMGGWVVMFLLLLFFFFFSDASTILSFFVTSTATWRFVSGRMSEGSPCTCLNVLFPVLPSLFLLELCSHCNNNNNSKVPDLRFEEVSTTTKQKQASIELPSLPFNSRCYYLLFAPSLDYNLGVGFRV